MEIPVCPQHALEHLSKKWKGPIHCLKTGHPSDTSPEASLTDAQGRGFHHFPPSRLSQRKRPLVSTVHHGERRLWILTPCWQIMAWPSKQERLDVFVEESTTGFAWCCKLGVLPVWPKGKVAAPLLAVLNELT